MEIWNNSGYILPQQKAKRLESGLTAKALDSSWLNFWNGGRIAITQGQNLEAQSTELEGWTCVSKREQGW